MATTCLLSTSLLVPPNLIRRGGSDKSPQNTACRIFDSFSNFDAETKLNVRAFSSLSSSIYFHIYLPIFMMVSILSILALLASSALALPSLDLRAESLQRALTKRQSLSSANSAGDVGILNFALALELVDISLFNGGLSNFTDGDFNNAGK